MRRLLVIGSPLAAAFAFSLAAHAKVAPDAAKESPPPTIADATKGLKGKGPLIAKIDVEAKDVKGTFTCTLFDDKTPATVANFVALARGLRPWMDWKTGKWVKKPFYDGLIFHRVVPNFMIQGGDPDGTGRGGPGFEFDDEIKPDLVFDKGGLLAMANKGINRDTGKGTNGSQFFITEKETPTLNGRHTIFGKCDPIDLEQKLARVPTKPPEPEPAEPGKPPKPVKPGTTPVNDIVIKKVTISRGKAK